MAGAAAAAVAALTVVCCCINLQLGSAGLFSTILPQCADRKLRQRRSDQTRACRGDEDCPSCLGSARHSLTCRAASLAFQAMTSKATQREIIWHVPLDRVHSGGDSSGISDANATRSGNLNRCDDQGRDNKTSAKSTTNKTAYTHPDQRTCSGPRALVRQTALDPQLAAQHLRQPLCARTRSRDGTGTPYPTEEQHSQTGTPKLDASIEATGLRRC